MPQIAAMRLQLTIQRNALPPTNILWNVRAQDPTSTSAHASATISQLLEDVNDIVQLESENWGLEDYVVEVSGFECLHFQPIDSVLKEDDKVTIRALQTSDLRLRKIGGRHQITSDGRHLFDGVAFGRPYLRKTSRPPFPIPPRKRRKLDLGHGQYIEDDSNLQALVTGSGSVADTAFNLDEGQSDPQISRERLWQIVESQLPEDSDQGSAHEEEDDDYDSEFESFDEDEGGEEGMKISEELKALLEDDPSEPDDEERGENDQVHDLESENNTFDTARQHKKRKRDSEDTSKDESLGSVCGSTSPPHLHDTVQLDRPHSSLVSASTSSSKAGDGCGDGVDSWGLHRSPLNDFEGFDEQSDSNDTSSSEVTSSESEDEADSANGSLSESGSMSSSTDSESNSTSGSDSESELGSPLEREEEVVATSPLSKRLRDGQAAKTESNLPARSVSVGTAPGEGLMRTKKNNQRAKRRNRLNLLKAAGLLAPDAGFKELSMYEETESEGPMTDDSSQKGSLEDDFEARKRELLEKLRPSEVESTPRSNHSADASEGTAHALTKHTNVVPAQPSAAEDEECHKTTPRKRAKLDLESSRRLVFGSLGLKTPKTAAAEQEIREKLAKQGRTSVKGRANGIMTVRRDGLETSGRYASERTEVEVWKDRLVLSAVECDIQGQILSAPPFPFVQHWQKSKQMNQLHHDLGNQDASNAEEQHDTITAPDDIESNNSYVDGDSILDGVKLNGAIQNQLMREAQELSQRQEANEPITPDLPVITDVDTLDALNAGDAVAGAVIAFKHLDMSVETNWQPEISAYRTAKIQEVLEDGTLKILLAERDRLPIPATFDDETGERILDKFEMLVEDEEEGPDNGIREVSYSDLIEPKLVEGKTLNTSVATSTLSAPTSAGVSKLNEDISQVNDSVKSNEQSVHQTTTQIEVSTPRAKEISKLIKDAGFHSALDSDLLEPTPKSPRPAGHSEEKCGASPQASEKHCSSGSINLDGISAETDHAHLDSPLFVGWESSSIPHDKQSEQGDQSSIVMETKEDRVLGSQTGVAYPKISQLLIDESKTLTISGKVRSTEAHSTSLIENGRPDHDSDYFGKGNGSIFEGEESQFDSLKSTIPPSEDVAPRSGPPSTTGSLITNPCFPGLDGNASSDDDLPSLSEITSTARSGQVSPPRLKRSSNVKQRISTSPRLPSSPDERTSTERTQAQIPSRFQPSQIRPESQVVDLTFSSDPISPQHSDEEYGSTQRSSVRIKQSSSQIKTRESLASSAKLGNRRLVRGKLGRPK